MSSPFRNQTNQRYTKQLFHDMQQTMTIEDRLIKPMFTLHHDQPGLINFRKVYVALGDPTGYKVSQEYLEDYSHWELLMKSPWFREAKEVWDRELDAKLSSEGLTAIRAFADGIEDVPPALQLQASKYLADKQYRKVLKEAPARGRPSKEEVTGELKKAVADTADIASDLARIRSVK